MQEFKHPDNDEVSQKFSMAETEALLNEKLDLMKKLMEDDGHVETKRVKLGRNDPCPCGSGKKFKRCCIKLVR